MLIKSKGASPFWKSFVHMFLSTGETLCSETHVWFSRFNSCKLVEVAKVGAANDDSKEGQVVGASVVGGGTRCCVCTVMFSNVPIL